MILFSACGLCLSVWMGFGSPSSTAGVAAFVALPPLMTEGVRDTRDSLPPSSIPVLTDALLIQWHSALMHMTDTLVVHPELQQTPELAPFMRLLTRTWRDTLYGNAFTWGGVLAGPVDTAEVSRQGGIPGFPVTRIARTLAKLPSIAAELKRANITPVQFVATTSAIVQEECALMAWYHYFNEHERWPIDPSSTLGKNLSFFRSDMVMVWEDVHGEKMAVFKQLKRKAGEYDGRVNYTGGFELTRLLLKRHVTAAEYLTTPGWHAGYDGRLIYNPEIPNDSAWDSSSLKKRLWPDP